MSEFIEVKTAELIGAALDWAVAQVDEVKTIMMSVRQSQQKKPFALFGSLALPLASEEGYAPSSCWHCGGPLIQKYRMDFCCEHPETIGAALCDENGMYIDEQMIFGSTHLEAACRALVHHKFGETVSVPKELQP